MIGSLHTMSYLEPHKWWKKPLMWLYRSQRVNIQEQYEKYEVRVFDIHLYFKGSHNRAVFKYGKVEYQTFSVYEILNYLNQQDNVYVRLVLDDSYVKHDKDRRIDLEVKFYNYCSNIELIYRDIHFFGGYRESDSKRIYHFKNDCPDNVIFYKNVHKLNKVKTP